MYGLYKTYHPFSDVPNNAVKMRGLLRESRDVEAAVSAAAVGAGPGGAATTAGHVKVRVARLLGRRGGLMFDMFINT